MQQYQAKNRAKVENVLNSLVPALTGQRSGVGSGQVIDDLLHRLGDLLAPAQARNRCLRLGQALRTQALGSTVD